MTNTTKIKKHKGRYITFGIVAVLAGLAGGAVIVEEILLTLNSEAKFVFFNSATGGSIVTPPIVMLLIYKNFRMGVYGYGGIIFSYIGSAIMQIGDESNSTLYMILGLLIFIVGSGLLIYSLYKDYKIHVTSLKESTVLK
jgi:hypothetical protein